MDLIRHFLHTHPLILTEEEEVNYENVCSVCRKGLSGPIYRCSNCRFFLHKSCAELPQEIQNFFHPCPLVLTLTSGYGCNACFEHGNDFSYRCKRCDFDMHVECALRPTIKSEGEEVIHHFTHWHPLTLVDQKKDLEVRCRICEKLFSGSSNSSAYGCEECNFFLHNSCMMDIPRQINHFFHPSCPLILLKPVFQKKCSSCDEDGSDLVFRCGKCHFQLDVKCALLPTVESKGADKIQHYAHWHPLTLVDQKNDLEVRCRICEELFSGCSNSSDYGCEECNFFLHNSCMMNIPQQINHFFHPSCPLILLKPPSHQKKCSSCDEDGSDLVFRCGKCHFQLDVKCALLPTVESKGADKIQHYAHQHPLALRENLEFDSEVRCGACGENCLDPCFVCERCNFFLHRSCAVELPQEIHHPFHPLHPLILSPLPPNLDHDTIEYPACGGMFDGFMLVYRCAKCDFNLHTNCAKPKLPPFLLKYGGHSHSLTFFDKTRAPFGCEICWGRAQNCFFRCVACEFNIHLYCHPSAPKTIKHRCHLHPLTLTDSPLEFELNSPEDACNSDDELNSPEDAYNSDDELNNSDDELNSPEDAYNSDDELNSPEDAYDSEDEFYCDVCEEKRYKYEKVYYCKKCKFIAEIRCVMSELLPSLTISEDRSTVKGRTISRDEVLEATIAMENNEIAVLRANKKPLEAEIEKLRAMLQTLENELKPIERRLEGLETDHFLHKDELSHFMKNKYPTEASTSEAQTADLS